MNSYSEIPFWKVLLTAAEEAHKLGEYARVEALLKRAVLAAGEGAEPVDLALALVHLGDMYEHQGRHLESEEAYRKASEIYDSFPGNDLLLAMTLRNLADVLCELDRHEEGAELRARALRLIFEAQQNGIQIADGRAVLKLPRPSESMPK